MESIRQTRTRHVRQLSLALFSPIVPSIMSGFFGLLSSEPISIPEGVIEESSRRLTTRGGDDLGLFRNDQGLLGMRSLPMDDARGPRPPVANESGRFRAVGEGEIYNHAEIRHRLEGNCHRFASRQPWEPLVHLAEENCLDWELGLRGMFAFALWDAKDRSIRLARDRFGIKPLYWCGDPDGIAFASTLPCLRGMLQAFGRVGEDPSLPVSLRRFAGAEGWCLNREALRWYLDTRGVPAPLTFYRGVHSLSPASRLLWKPGTAPRIENYWQPTYEPKRVISVSSAIPLFEEVFRESIRHHLVSDDPIGALLSGEVDSGLIVAEAASQIGKRLSTFTVILPESDPSEVRMTREIAKVYGTDHHEVTMDPFDRHDLPKIVSAMNQPLGSPSTWWTWAMSRAIGSCRKGVLSGEGGDEVWGGTPCYPGHNRGRWFPRIPGSSFESSWQKSTLGSYAAMLRDFGSDPQDLYRRWRRPEPKGFFWNRLLRSEFQSQPVEFPDPVPPGDWHADPLEIDVGLSLPAGRFEQLDSMSMAHSLEVRVPWLDPVLFEVIAHLPNELKINGGITKWLARRVSESGRLRLPKSLNRRKRKGFATPVGRWISNELREVFQDLTLSQDSKIGDLMELASLRRYYEAHRSGEAELGSHLWAVLILEIWFRQNQVGS